MGVGIMEECFVGFCLSVSGNDWVIAAVLVGPLTVVNPMSKRRGRASGVCTRF